MTFITIYRFALWLMHSMTSLFNGGKKRQNTWILRPIVLLNIGFQIFQSEAHGSANSIGAQAAVSDQAFNCPLGDRQKLCRLIRR